MSEKEPLPVNEYIKVLEYVTIYKTDKWWQAVALINQAGHERVAIFLWLYDKGKWKRKHKFTTNRPDNWNKVKQAVEQMLDKMMVINRGG